MKVAAAIALGAGLVATALTPFAASAQQYAYAPPEHGDYQPDSRAYGPAPAYGRYGQRYAGRPDAPVYGVTRDYGDSRYAREAPVDGGRYEQRALRQDERGYRDGQGYAVERSYRSRDDAEVGYDAGYRGGEYGGAEYGGGGYGRGGYDRGYVAGRGYDAPGYGYGSGEGYEDSYIPDPYVDRYTGFSAPPINYRDVERQQRELAPAYADRGCGCGG